MTPEVHAVILWSTALTATDRIVDDLSRGFELVGDPIGDRKSVV